MTANAKTANQRTFLGHPLGLYVLFFTEMWERFSFYGMKALLMLYMLNHFTWTQGEASVVMGWYVFFVYAMPVIGGIIADHLLGARRTVVLGAVLLAVGHFLMAFEPLPFFYTALAFIIAGVGCLKPNISTQVGNLYPPGDLRRDGAFTIFYMGINTGAFFGPLVCDWLRTTYGYHYGFAAAGVGMVLGLIVYVIGQRKLVEFRQDVSATREDQRIEHPAHVVRDRVIVLTVVFAFVILFWMAFEQSANVMIVWADKHTNLRPFSSEPPPVVIEGSSEDQATSSGRAFALGAGQTQSINPFFIITLAPVFAFFWIWLGRRNLQPSTPGKMAMGIALVALAFVALLPAASAENGASSAPLAQLPIGVDLNKYGATRLNFDPQSRSLRMNGVLPDLDRLNLLAASAPQEIVRSVDSLVKKSVEAPRAPDSAGQQAVTEVLPSAPADFKIAGQAAQTVLRWDAASRTLTATGEIKDRARLEVLAAAADHAFRKAVDTLYVDSSRYRVSIWWLVLHFLVATMGELCLSPVGLSLVTKLAPPRYVGMLMGGWFLATAVADKLANVFGEFWGTMTPTRYFMMFVVICGVGCLLMAAVIRPLKRMMHGVQ